MKNDFTPTKLNHIIGHSYTKKVLSGFIRSAIQHSEKPQNLWFYGFPGIAKTTTAKWLAAALNCSSFNINKMEICGVCDSCLNYLNCHDYRYCHVIRGNDIQKTLKKVPELYIFGFAPSYNYNVVIFDEAHLATKKSQMTLLKCLDENYSKTFAIFITVLDNDLTRSPLLEQLRDRLVPLEFNRLNDTEALELLDRIEKIKKIKFSDKVKNSLISQSRGSGRSLIKNALTAIVTNEITK